MLLGRHVPLWLFACRLGWGTSSAIAATGHEGVVDEGATVERVVSSGENEAARREELRRQALAHAEWVTKNMPSIPPNQQEYFRTTQQRALQAADRLGRNEDTGGMAGFAAEAIKAAEKSKVASSDNAAAVKVKDNGLPGTPASQKKIEIEFKNTEVVGAPTGDQQLMSKAGRQELVVDKKDADVTAKAAQLSVTTANGEKKLADTTQIFNQGVQKQATIGVLFLDKRLSGGSRPSAATPASAEELGAAKGSDGDKRAAADVASAARSAGSGGGGGGTASGGRLSESLREMAIGSYIQESRGALGIASGSKQSFSESALYQSAPPLLRDILRESFGAVLKNDMLGAKPSAYVDPLNKVVGAPGFQGVAAKVLGEEQLAKLNYASVGANVLKDPDVSAGVALASAQAVSLGGKLPMPSALSALGSPSSVGASPGLATLAQLAESEGGAGSVVPPSAEPLIETARRLSRSNEATQAYVRAAGFDPESLLQGRRELEAFILRLRAYKSLDLLAKLRVPLSLDGGRFRGDVWRRIRSTARKMADIPLPPGRDWQSRRSPLRRRHARFVEVAAKLGAASSIERDLYAFLEDPEMRDFSRQMDRVGFEELRRAAGFLVFADVSPGLADKSNLSPLGSLLLASFRRLDQLEIVTAERRKKERQAEVAAPARAPTSLK